MSFKISHTSCVTRMGSELERFREEGHLFKWQNTP